MQLIVSTLISCIDTISSVISKIFKFKDLYIILGIFFTRKFKEAKKQHKYAILVAARNEEAVIGNLIDSIRKQDYPADLTDIFVVADNCTDNTARCARELGAITYERFDTEHRTKGYALGFLVECIKRDFGIDKYEAYLIFDADNLLAPDYMTRMNESYDAGEKIVTSYRNTKNFADNWISASYALHWLRTIRNEHRARSFLHLATRIQGTGFLFDKELIRDGWKYTSLTEDRAFCADAVAKGYKISYNNDAVFYDEQPVDLRIAMRQRIRWSKGHIQSFFESGGQLFWHIFCTNGAANRPELVGDPSKLTKGKRLFNNLRMRFMSLDILSIVYPRRLVRSALKLLFFILRLILIVFTAAYSMTGEPNSVLKFIFQIFEYTPEAGSSGVAIAYLLLFAIFPEVFTYVRSICNAIYVFVFEHSKIEPIPFHKKVWFCLAFPIFDIMGEISLWIAAFTKVEWKPIPHNAAINISQLRKK